MISHKVVETHTCRPDWRLVITNVILISKHTVIALFVPKLGWTGSFVSSLYAEDVDACRNREHIDYM
jgi:hypothetical protein